jgi:hypothetical protein
MTLSGPQDARFLSPSRSRAGYISDVGKLSARHDEIGDLDLHSLIILVKVGDQICVVGFTSAHRSSHAETAQNDDGGSI